MASNRINRENCKIKSVNSHFGTPNCIKLTLGNLVFTCEVNENNLGFINNCGKYVEINLDQELGLLIPVMNWGKAKHQKSDIRLNQRKNSTLELTQTSINIPMLTQWRRICIQIQCTQLALSRSESVSQRRTQCISRHRCIVCLHKSRVISPILCNSGAVKIYLSCVSHSYFLFHWRARRDRSYFLLSRCSVCLRCRRRTKGEREDLVSARALLLLSNAFLHIMACARSHQHDQKVTLRLHSSFPLCLARIKKYLRRLAAGRFNDFSLLSFILCN